MRIAANAEQEHYGYFPEIETFLKEVHAMKRLEKSWTLISGEEDEEINDKPRNAVDMH